MLGVPWYVIGAATLVVASLPILGWAVSGSRRAVSSDAAGRPRFDGRNIQLR
jgi:hypothetical protein